MQEEDLLGRIKSLKNFFFFEKSDYFIHFIDLAEEELNKKTE
jgi:gamma-tubulin complex component 2